MGAFHAVDVLPEEELEESQEEEGKVGRTKGSLGVEGQAV